MFEVQIVLLPFRNELGKMLIWCDNCRNHLTTAVKNTITESDMDVAILSKSATSGFQVFDLVVNGPSNAHIRNKQPDNFSITFQEQRFHFTI